MFDFTLDTNEVVKALALEDFDKDVQEQMAERVRTLLDERVAIRVESSLTEEQLADLADLNDNAAVKAYVQKLVPDAGQLYSEELDDLLAQLREDLGLK